MKKLSGKVAIVTGASKGIGASIAKDLAAEGASVVVNYASARKEAEQVVAEITAQDGKAFAIQGDVSKAQDVQRIFEKSQQTFGALHILVNNAGVYQFAALEAVTEEEFHREFNINVLGTILATREALKYFGPAGGSVINLSSVVSTNPMAGTAVYAATKGAIDTLTVGLSRELGPRKIRVNAIAPGGVDTEGAKILGMIGGDMEKYLVSQTPLARIGQPRDISKVAVFLASDESAWLTGERISSSGGFR